LLFCFLLSNLVVWTGLDGGVSFSLHADYFPKAALFSRKAHGDEKRMLVLFFDRIGWPTSLPTSEKGSFMKSVLREKVSISSITWPSWLVVW
jgi:hypothetical protein